jgi:hypothetical protein
MSCVYRDHGSVLSGTKTRWDRNRTCNLWFWRSRRHVLLRSVWFHNSVDAAFFHASCSVQFRFSRGLCCHFCCHKLTVINSLTCDHAADFKFERIWLPLNADGCRCRNLRTLAAVFVRHRSLLVVRAAVKVAVKSRSDPLGAGHLWGTPLAATMQYEKLHSRRSERQELQRREEQRLQSGPTLWEETE